MRHPLRGVACVFSVGVDQLFVLSFRNVVRNLSVTMYSTLDFKVKYKNLSPPLFIEEVARAKRCDGGVKTPTTVVADRCVCPANTSNSGDRITQYTTGRADPAPTKSSVVNEYLGLHQGEQYERQSMKLNTLPPVMWYNC